MALQLSILSLALWVGQFRVLFVCFLNYVEAKFPSSSDFHVRMLLFGFTRTRVGHCANKTDIQSGPQPAFPSQSLAPADQALALQMGDRYCLHQLEL